MNLDGRVKGSHDDETAVVGVQAITGPGREDLVHYVGRKNKERSHKDHDTPEGHVPRNIIVLVVVAHLEDAKENQGHVHEVEKPDERREGPGDDRRAKDTVFADVVDFVPDFQDK